MPQKLENLLLNEISLVDRPANSEKGIPRARVALFKRDGGGEGSDFSAATLHGDCANHTTGDERMTLEEIMKRQDAQEAALEGITKANAFLKKENQIVIKMSTEDRKKYAAMSEADREKYVDGDEEAKKALMAKAFPPKDEPDGDEVDGEEEDVEDEGEKKVTAKKALLIKKLADVDALTARVQKAEAALAAQERGNRVAKFARRAETDLPHTSGTPEEKGETIMKLVDAFGEDTDTFKKIYGQLVEADKAMALQFTEVGKSGGTVPAERVFMAKVEEIQKRDGIPQTRAVDKAMQEAPQLYLDYEKSQRSLAGRQ